MVFCLYSLRRVTWGAWCWWWDEVPPKFGGEELENPVSEIVLFLQPHPWIHTFRNHISQHIFLHPYTWLEDRLLNWLHTTYDIVLGIVPKMSKWFDDECCILTYNQRVDYTTVRYIVLHMQSKEVVTSSCDSTIHLGKLILDAVWPLRHKSNECMDYAFCRPMQAERFQGGIRVSLLSGAKQLWAFLTRRVDHPSGVRPVLRVTLQSRSLDVL